MSAWNGIYEPGPERDETERFAEPCPRCGGSGLSPENWDCQLCDGEGEIPA